MLNLDVIPPVMKRGTMSGDVKKCIEMRTGFLNKYFTVPPEMKTEVDNFFKRLNTLGEECHNSAEFEERFAAEGYSDEFNNIYPRCPQKASSTGRTMAEDVSQYISVTDTGNGNCSTISSAAEESELQAEEQKTMEKEDVIDDYTRTRNHVDSLRNVFRFFHKKKDKEK